MKSVKFSFPLWPGLSEKDIDQVVDVLNKGRAFVQDIYFTSRIAPFSSDAMGGIIFTEDINAVYNNAKYVSQKTGIPLSATYNNIIVSPSEANYKIFVNNFRKLYDDGCRIVTIPFTTWLRLGLKDEFPDLFVKNTIIHKVSEPAEVAKLFAEGFDYINIDRNLMRNADRLEEIKNARDTMEKKLGRKLYLSLLMNEMCDSYCSVQEDHYSYNFNRTAKDASYFTSDIKKTASCVVADQNSPEYLLRTATIPSYYSQLDYYSQFVDVFKLHGRESKNVFFNSLEIVRNYASGSPMNDKIKSIIKRLDPKLEKKFLEHIKNCKFDCWKCNMCSVMAEKVK